MLILDLDDTIFETKSIGKSNFSIIMELIEELLTPKIGNESVNQIVEELWNRPFDVVMNKFNVGLEDQNKIAFEINELDFNLNISTYQDYSFLQDISMDQILVTTGFPKLQFAKIEALGIKSDFKEIYIDDITQKNRIHKKGIFKKIIEQSNKSPSQICVIGDNPESEIKAGNELNMKTILRKTLNIKSSKYADYEIDSFEELKAIIK